MAPAQTYDAWRALKIRDVEGKRIGTLQCLFVNRRTGEPEWATVKTGIFGETGRAGLKTVFVPLGGAKRTDDDELQLMIHCDQVEGAPRLAAGAALTPEHERRLYAHYPAHTDPEGGEQHGALEQVL
jgi:hypothetical protein